MKQLNTEWKQWNKFGKYLSQQNRYILNKKWTSYLDKLLTDARNKEDYIKKDREFWRARIGCSWRETKKRRDLFPVPITEIGAPPIGKVSMGRINPKGMRYLYLANDKQTAIYEVKPYLNEHVTLAKFKIKKDLTIVNLCKYDKGKSNSWDNISFWFSLPLRPSNISYEYLPIQYLAAAFQEAGYDGIQYKSSLNNGGHNIVIFNPNNAKITKTRAVVHILSIQCEYNYCSLK